ncbi:MAG TPA: M23 family metallopeptidase [Burkholderiales bacterium]
MNEGKTRIVTQRYLQAARRPWLAAAFAVPVFGVVAAFATVQPNPEPVLTRAVVEALPLSAEIAVQGSATPYFHEERFQRGDTVTAVLARLGADGDDARALLASPGARRLVRLMRPGTTVQATTQDAKLQSMWFLSGTDSLTIVERKDGAFTASERTVSLSREVELRTGQIASSLFAATDAAGVPDNVASQIADIFAGDVDFQRDLRRGDRFTVAFEMFYHEGRPIRSGRLLAADFTNQRHTYRAIWFQPADGPGGYYSPDGKNLRKAFLRSPLEYSRISSGFGMRNHPILQQWRAHKGVDYAAPIGTRVRATGDGVVDFAGKRNGYGNVIVLRHNGGYSTYYAHLNGFARGVQRGVRVAQGDIIGYVGQSGWATGPHLHYEFHVRNEYRNPLTLAMPASNPVPHHLLIAFFQASQPLAAQLDLLKNTDVALLE